MFIKIKSNILKGREIIIGGSIIIFIDIKMFVIIIFIIKNGIKIIKFIWNVVLSFDMVKVGIIVVSGIFFNDLGLFIFV